MPALGSAKEALVLEEKAFKLGDWKDERDVETTFSVPKEVQEGGTLWAHIYIALAGYPLDPIAKDYSIASAYHIFRPLNQILPKKKVVKTKKLLGSANVTEELEEESPANAPKKLGSYYHPNFTMSFIPDSGTQSYVNMHPAVRQFTTLETSGARDASGQNGWYYPTLFVNTFWQLRDHMTELNSTVNKVPLHITLNNLNNWKFSLYASIDEGVKTTQRNVAEGGSVPASGDGSEFEEFKKILLDTNVWLLSTTAVVTVLHMLFEALAFKSDIVSIASPSFRFHLQLLYSASTVCRECLTESQDKTNPSYLSPTGATRKTTLASPSAPSLPTSSCKPSSSSTCSTTTKIPRG